MYKINFEKPVHVHFIGIGGISMSGLAEILLKEGFTISGSDNKESALTDHLEKLGPKYSTDRKLLILFPASMLLYILPQFILITKNSQKL